MANRSRQDLAVAGDRASVHAVYGLTLASEIPFRTPLSPGDGPPDFSLVRSAEPFGLPKSEPIYTSSRRAANGRSVLTIGREAGVDTLLLADDTCLRIAGERIEVSQPSVALSALTELFLLGTLVSYLLEQHGTPVLHAATVEVDGRAVAFLAGNRGGKSSLAAGFLQAGYGLISDDLLPVVRAGEHYRAEAGYPQMRFWPDQARQFARDPDGLERVHPDLEKLRVPIGPGGLGRFSGRGAALAAIYIPERYAGERRAATIETLPLSSREAVVALTRELFLRPVLEKLGLMAARLAFFAALVGEVPVRRLRYPSGTEHLPAVCEGIRRELNATG